MIVIFSSLFCPSCSSVIVRGVAQSTLWISRDYSRSLGCRQEWGHPGKTRTGSWRWVKSSPSELPDVVLPFLLPSLLGRHIHQALWKEPANYQGWFLHIYISYFLSYLPSVFSAFSSQKDQLWPEGKSFCRGGRRCPSNMHVFVSDVIKREQEMWPFRCDLSNTLGMMVLLWCWFFVWVFLEFVLFSLKFKTNKNHLHKS